MKSNKIRWSFVTMQSVASDTFHSRLSIPVR
nr:MAG TPA: hypothetical protein [Caudoviricetes sp.]